MITSLLSLPDSPDLEIIKSGTAVISKAINTDFAEVIVAHNLDFVPTLIAYLANSDGSFSLLPSLSYRDTGADLGKNTQNVSGYVFLNDVYLFVDCPNLPTGNTLYTSSLSLTIKYFLLRLAR